MPLNNALEPPAPLRLGEHRNRFLDEFRSVSREQAIAVLEVPREGLVGGQVGHRGVKG